MANKFYAIPDISDVALVAKGFSRSERAATLTSTSGTASLARPGPRPDVTLSSTRGTTVSGDAVLHVRTHGHSGLYGESGSQSSLGATRGGSNNTASVSTALAATSGGSPALPGANLTVRFDPGSNWQQLVDAADATALESMYHAKLKAGGAGMSGYTGVVSQLHSVQPTLQSSGGNAWGVDPHFIPALPGSGLPGVHLVPPDSPSQFPTERKQGHMERVAAQEAAKRLAIRQELQSKVARLTNMMKYHDRIKRDEERDDERARAAGEEPTPHRNNRRLRDFGPQPPRISDAFLTRLRRVTQRTWQLRVRQVNNPRLQELRHPPQYTALELANWPPHGPRPLNANHYRLPREFVPAVDVHTSSVQFLALPTPEDRLEFLRALVPPLLWATTAMFMSIPRPHGSMLRRQQYVWVRAVDEAYARAQTRALNPAQLQFAVDVGLAGGGIGYLPTVAKHSQDVASRARSIPAWYDAGRKPSVPDAFAAHRAAQEADKANQLAAAVKASRRHKLTPAQTFDANRKFGKFLLPADPRLRMANGIPQTIADVIGLPAGSNPGGAAARSTARAAAGEDGDRDSDFMAVVTSGGTQSPGRAFATAGGAATFHDGGAWSSSRGVPRIGGPGGDGVPGHGALRVTTDGSLGGSRATMSGSQTAPSGTIRGANADSWTQPMSYDTQPRASDGYTALMSALPPVPSPSRGGWTTPRDATVADTPVEGARTSGRALDNTLGLSAAHRWHEAETATPIAVSGAMPQPSMPPVLASPEVTPFFRHSNDLYYSVSSPLSKHLESKRRYNRHQPNIGARGLQAVVDEVAVDPAAVTLASTGLGVKLVNGAATVTRSLTPVNQSLRKNSSSMRLGSSALSRSAAPVGGNQPTFAASKLPTVLQHPLQREDVIDPLHTMTGALRPGKQSRVASRPGDSNNALATDSLWSLGSEWSDGDVEAMRLSSMTTCIAPESAPWQAKSDYRDTMLGIVKLAMGWMNAKPHVAQDLLAAVCVAWDVNQIGDEADGMAGDGQGVDGLTVTLHLPAWCASRFLCRQWRSSCGPWPRLTMRDAMCHRVPLLALPPVRSRVVLHRSACTSDWRRRCDPWQPRPQPSAPVTLCTRDIILCVCGRFGVSAAVQRSRFAWYKPRC